MSPIQNKPKEKTEQDKQLEALREQVAKAESKGNFNTCHHDMLKQLEKKEVNNG
jgi:hypothetical protein